MLVLACEPGQKIIVGEGKNEVTVCVQRVAGKKVRLSFEADVSVKIWREKLFNAIQAEKEATNGDITESD